MSLLWLWLLTVPETLPARARVWSALQTPAPGQAEAIGTYTNGCLRGGKGLPASGPGFEVLHLGRRRFYGHPHLVDLVRKLGRLARANGLAPLLIGDLAQPRGGPTPFGHRSHQSGLDVDIGFTQPAWMRRRRPTAAERESMQMPSVVDLDKRALNGAWDPRVRVVLARASADPRVSRIFVHPAIKRALCERPEPWLQKVRPWWGHHDHFHVRLYCPVDSPACEPQEALPPGDGCGEIAWWFTDDARRAQQDRRANGVKEAASPPPLPPACLGLLTGERPPAAMAK